MSRSYASGDVETTSTVVGAADFGSSRASDAERGTGAAEGDQAIIRGWRPDLLNQFGVGPIVAAKVLCTWSHPAVSTPRRRSRCSPAWRRSRRTMARSPRGLGSTVTATASSTAHCTPWSRAVSRTSQPPATTSLAPKLRKDRPRDQTLPRPLRRTRPLSPTRKPGHNCLTKRRSVAAVVLPSRRRSGCALRGRVRHLRLKLSLVPIPMTVVRHPSVPSPACRPGRSPRCLPQFGAALPSSFSMTPGRLLPQVGQWSTSREHSRERHLRTFCGRLDQISGYGHVEFLRGCSRMKVA